MEMLLACQTCNAKTNAMMLSALPYIIGAIVAGIVLFYILRDGFPTKKNAWRRKILRSLRREWLWVESGSSLSIKTGGACDHCGFGDPHTPMLTYVENSGADDYGGWCNYKTVCADRPPCRARRKEMKKRVKVEKTRVAIERDTHLGESVVL